jgi:hypothetical protein
MASHSRGRAKYPAFSQLNRNILRRARIDFGRASKFKPKQLLPIQVASPLPYRPYLTSVLYQISTGFSDAGINFCVQDRHVVRQPFSFGCPACFEWPNGGPCSEPGIEPGDCSTEVSPLDFGYRRWQFQKVERVCRFERADRSTAGIGLKILGLFGKAVEGDSEEYTNTLPQVRRTKKVRALQDSATTVNRPYLQRRSDCYELSLYFTSHSRALSNRYRAASNHLRNRLAVARWFLFG